MSKPILEVVDNELKHTNQELQHTNSELELLKLEIKELKEWKANCTKWAMWWAGVCAACMAMLSFIQTYWDKIQHYLGK